MVLIPAKFDTAKGRVVADPSAAGSITDQDFDATADQTDFTLSSSFDNNSVIEVWVNGRQQREGATYAFQRDTVNNKIVFNVGVNEGSWVKVRITENGAASFYTLNFDATNGQTEFTVGTINDTQTIDVVISGRMNREGGSHDYTRNTSTLKIIMNKPLNGGEWVLIRVFNN